MTKKTNKQAINETAPPLVDASRTRRTEKLLLVLNAGSSSLKFALFDGRSSLVRIFSGVIDRIGSPEATFTLKGKEGQQMERKGISAPNHIIGLDYLLKRLAEMTGTAGFGAVGHRVVHGGPHYRDPQKVDHTMLDDLRRIRSLDP